MQTTNEPGVQGRMLCDRYEVRGVLGRGGMAEVRDGWDTRLNRGVAIKLLHPWVSAQPELRERFQTEARAAAGLNHPNIVSVHDCDEDGGTPFIVMERLPGATLADRIEDDPLPEAEVRCVLDKVLAAIATSHAMGILHRDIKPGNVLMAGSGDLIKVTDFGIAKTPGTAHTLTGQIVGTLAYLSPERVSGAPASVADDIYAVGVVGYEALAGRRPFTQDDNIAALARAILTEQPAPLSKLRPDVDPRLIAVIEQAMARDPVRRFNSAEHMRAAVKAEEPAMTGAQPAASQLRPPTKLLDEPPIPRVTGTFVQPGTYVPPGRPQLHLTGRRVLSAATVFAALAIAALVLALGSSSRQGEPTEPVTTSTSVSPPASSPLPPPPSPVVQQPVNPSHPDGTNGGGKKGNQDKKGKGGRGN